MRAFEGLVRLLFRQHKSLSDFGPMEPEKLCPEPYLSFSGVDHHRRKRRGQAIGPCPATGEHTR